MNGSATPTSYVNIAGADSRLLNTKSLYVGFAGTAELDISQGGSVSSKSTFIGYRPQEIPPDDGGSGGNPWLPSREPSLEEEDVVMSMSVVRVDGTDSSMNNEETLYVGYEGVGSLHVTNGATSTHGAAFVGFKEGSSGTVEVDGAGSTLTVNGNLSVGDEGAGRMRITNGGSVVSDDTGTYPYLVSSVGDSSTSSGVIEIDGTGSNWIALSRLDDLGVLKLSFRIPHASCIADQRRNRRVDDHVTGHVEIRDALI